LYGGGAAISIAIWPSHGQNAGMKLPIVAIVGRPNVGKSSILNRLAGRRISIVDPMPGVTRDRVSTPLEIAGGFVELVDTGGMGIEDADQLTEDVEAQIAYALAAASVILFIVDAREGILPLDRRVAEALRRQDRPVILVGNKVDEEGLTTELGELHGLGFGDPVVVSAVNGRGFHDLLDAMAERLADVPLGSAPESRMQLAIVGKRNAGKSTFINALAGEPRVIVSEVPGTTRDSVDVDVEFDGRKFTLIDTAGVQKKRKLDGGINFYSQHRAMRSIRRADVVALMIDASLAISQVDKALAGEIAEQIKPVLLVVNKWDLAQGKAEAEDYAEYLAKSFPELSFAPISFTTASTGMNVRETIDLAEQLFRQANTRVGTGQLNVVIQEILALRGPSHKTGTRPPKILYASQTATSPPTIVCFVNDPASFDKGYERFLMNQFHARLPFKEVPIRLILRRHRQTEEQE
jgi:GTP-binding protein